MRRTISILTVTSIASCAAIAQEDAVIDAPVPPQVIVLPVQAIVTLRPVSVELLRVLASTSPDPAALRLIVERIAPGDIAMIVVQLAASPRQIATLVAALTPEQTAAVVLMLPPAQPAFNAFVSHLSSAQTAAVALTVADHPAALAAFVRMLDDGQAASALHGLCAPSVGGDKLQAFVAQCNPDRLQRIRAVIFITDIDAWMRLNSFIFQEPPTDSRRMDVSGIDATRDALRKRIAREGYSPEILKEAEALMQRAMQPENRSPLSNLKKP